MCLHPFSSLLIADNQIYCGGNVPIRIRIVIHLSVISEKKILRSCTGPDPLLDPSPI